MEIRREPEFAPLALQDRAARFLADREVASEDELLAHVFGGPPPAALRARLAAPLLSDPRLERRADGLWTLRGRPGTEPTARAFTALAVVASGPSPPRARLVHVSAAHVLNGEVIERFSATLNPQRRVPRYVADRLGMDTDALESQPDFAHIIDDLVRFLGERPVLAQDAALAWGFLHAEARGMARVLAAPALVDVNDLAVRRLSLRGKPTLGLVAAQLGISSVNITHPDEEVRVLALVGARLLSAEDEAGAADAWPVAASRETRPLRRATTARSLPEQPGVYVLRDRDNTALYVGKARRLRTRMAAYVHRQLGVTRRLEGLVGAVQQVETTSCETDLDALVLEDREIRRLQPRFNTVRQQRLPRFWIRLPPLRQASAKRPAAPRRLELSAGPLDEDAGEFVGPFRNETLAEEARLLAREVFDLDALRRSDRSLYQTRLAQAWRFLQVDGDSSVAETLAAQRGSSLLRKVVRFELTLLLLPADPRQARYAVIRHGLNGIEGFLVDRADFKAWTVLDPEDLDASAFARRLLAPTDSPRTTDEDRPVVLRWFGAQRPPARLVWLPDDALAAADAIASATLDLSGEA